MQNQYVEVKDIKTIHQLLLKIFNEFHAVCEKHSLKYTLDYGTLIGAVRHKGFIPWDDDIDVAMARPDYEKLIKILKSEPNDLIEVIDFNAKTYCYPMIKIGLKDTVLYERLAPKYAKSQLYIDVFPLDALPKTYKEKKKSLKYVVSQRKKVSACVHQITPFTTWWKKPLIVLKHLRKFIYSLVPVNKRVQKQIKNVLKTDYNSSDYIAYRFSMIDGEVPHELPKNFIDDLILVDFENTKAYISKHYDLRLTQEYGDYMKLPPKSQQVPRHDFKLFVDKKYL